MEEDVLFRIIPTEKYDLLTREELIILAKGEQDLRMQMQKEVTRLRALHDELKQRTLAIGDQLIVIKNKMFGKSSERSAKSPADKDSKNKVKKTKVQLPSLRYPNAPVIERRIELSVMPDCKACGEKLVDSGMTEDSEYLTVIPEQFFVVKQLRHKYCCDRCHGDIQTAPCPPRIKDKSSYSDEMVIDVAMSKYCDLIPIERYSSIAGRAGLKDLPANSLIASTHNLADFLEPVYGMLREAIRLSKILHADETPHRMLEGDKTPYWQLWGFSNGNTSYFEAHGTRSGDVAIDVITESKCEYLVSDVFSGYGRAVKEANKIRKEKNLPQIQNIYCNAHARRKFKESEENFPDAKFFIDQYKEIYRLNKEAKDKLPEEILKTRSQMTEYFTAMRSRAMETLSQYSSKSAMAKVIKYFLKSYDYFIVFITNPELPIDNNPQERLMRNPVIGRKTWYGTHSKRGAETAQILFSIVETCRLNQVNPREYLRKLIQDMHAGKAPYTPAQFKAH